MTRRIALMCLFALTITMLCSTSVWSDATDLQSLSEGEAPTAEQFTQLQEHLGKLAAELRKATVGIRRGGSQGSGVIVSKDGYILTAAHVSGRPGGRVTIIMPDGSTKQGKVLGANLNVDAGMIKADDDGPWPHVEIGKSKPLADGQWCIALGHPGGFQAARPAPLRLGRILRNRAVAVDTDCMLISGDSGGPLFDLDGKLIGIHSRIGSTLMANAHVPVDAFTSAWDRMVKGEVWGGRGLRRGSPFIGIQADTTAPEAKVLSVVPDSPAQSAGLQAGDIIIRFGDKEVSSFPELVRAVRSSEPGQQVKLVVVREDEEVTLDLTVGKYGQPAPSARPAQPAPQNKEADKPQPEGEKSATNPDDADAGTDADADAGTDTDADTDADADTDTDTDTDADADADQPDKRAAPDAPADKPEPQTKPEQPGKQDRQSAEARQAERRKAIAEARLRQQKLFAVRLDQLRQTERDRERSHIEKNHARVLDALADVTAQVNPATVRVLSGQRQVALGLVVDERGYVLTKASELRPDPQVRLASGPRLKAEVVGVIEAHDLALLKLPAADLAVVPWSAEPPTLGSVLITPDGDEQPLAFGVVSVESRKLHARGFLGIGFKEGSTDPRIGQVIPGSAAAKAELKADDLILMIDQQPMPTGEAVVEFMANRRPGDEIKLKVQRGEKTVELVVELGSRLSGARAARFSNMNMLGGALSDRRSDFEAVVQHDTVLYPDQCGGPIVGLDGKVVGVNIARAGRINSYALPAKLVRDAAAQMIAGKHKPTADFKRALQVRAIEDQVKRTTLDLYRAEVQRDAAAAAAARAAKTLDALKARQDALEAE